MSESTRNGNGALRVRSMDELLAALDERGQPPAAAVEIPEWGALFRVRGLSRAEVLHINQRATEPRSGRVNQALLEELTLVTAIVEPAFTAEHYRRLRHRHDSSAAITRLENKIAELTSGEKPDGTDGGGEVDAVMAASFPAGT